MALSNTAVPRYYGAFRDAVIRGEVPINKEIEMEMQRIDELIDNPGVYYDDQVLYEWGKKGITTVEDVEKNRQARNASREKKKEAEADIDLDIVDWDWFDDDEDE